MNAMYQNVFIIIDKDLTNAYYANNLLPTTLTERRWKVA